MERDVLGARDRAGHGRCEAGAGLWEREHVVWSSLFGPGFGSAPRVRKDETVRVELEPTSRPGLVACGRRGRGGASVCPSRSCR